MLTLLIFVLLAMPQAPPDAHAVHYTAKLTVPKSGKITIVYDDLYPGKRSKIGGCYFMDVTKPGSLMPILEDKPDHVTIKAPVGHVVEYHCNWNTN